MANFAEKIGEKLHMGGHRKEDEQLYGYGGQPGVGMTHAGDHAVGYGPGYGEHPNVAAYPQHAGGMYGAGPGVATGYGVPATTAAPHQGPLQKVKNKVKAKKEGRGDSSSSSSSESDGEGGRRKKKFGIF
ncbi:hypothetical protein L7F22_012580 [Adiantum nelumboides]|nr:hypothetical protein [Adiantum nelumboides]